MSGACDSRTQTYRVRKSSYELKRDVLSVIAVYATRLRGVFAPYVPEVGLSLSHLFHSIFVWEFSPIFQLLSHCIKSLTNYFDDGNFSSCIPLLTRTESRQHAAAALPALLTSLAEGPFIPNAPRLVAPLQVWELHLAKALIAVCTLCVYSKKLFLSFNFSPRSSPRHSHQFLRAGDQCGVQH